jgi:S1-C subfamily serine protease
MERAPQEADAAEAPGAVAGRARRFVVGALLAYWLGSSGGNGEEAAPGPSATPTPGATLTVPDVFKRVGPSVVVIQAGKSLGTGVIAAEDGTILTAHHVVKGTSNRGAILITAALSLSLWWNRPRTPTR